MASNLEALARSIDLSTGRFFDGLLLGLFRLGLCRRALLGGSFLARNFVSRGLLRCRFFRGCLLRSWLLSG